MGSLAVTLAGAALIAFVRLTVVMTRTETKIDAMCKGCADHEERLRRLEHGGPVIEVS